MFHLSIVCLKSSCHRIFMEIYIILSEIYQNKKKKKSLNNIINFCIFFLILKHVRKYYLTEFGFGCCVGFFLMLFWLGFSLKTKEKKSLRGSLKYNLS